MIHAIDLGTKDDDEQETRDLKQIAAEYLTSEKITNIFIVSGTKGERNLLILTLLARSVQGAVE